MSPEIDKASILKSVINSMNGTINNLEKGRNSATEEAKNAPTAQDSRSDQTRDMQSRVANAYAQMVTGMKERITQLESQVGNIEIGKTETIHIGSIVELEDLFDPDNPEIGMYMALPLVNLSVVPIEDGNTITIINSESTLASNMIGKREGEQIQYTEVQKGRTIEGNYRVLRIY